MPVSTAVQRKNAMFQAITMGVVVLLLGVALFVIHKLPGAQAEVETSASYEAHKRAEIQHNADLLAWQYMKDAEREPAIPVRIVP
jgi:cell division protein FtsN